MSTITTSRPARPAGLDRVEGDGRRIRSPRAPDEVGAGTLGPDLELLLGRGPERVRRTHEHGSSVLGELARELADRRRLSGAVHPDDENDGRTVRGRRKDGSVSEERLDLVRERVAEVADLAAGLEAPDELGSRR